MLKGIKYLNGRGKGRVLLICLGFSVAAVIVCAFVMSLAAMAFKNPGELVGIFSLVGLLISAMIGGVFSGRMHGEGGVLYSALVALGVTFVMLAVGLISCGGRLSGGAFMNYLCYVGVATMAALAARNAKGGKRRRRKR